MACSVIQLALRFLNLALEKVKAQNKILKGCFSSFIYFFYPLLYLVFDIIL